MLERVRPGPHGWKGTEMNRSIVINREFGSGGREIGRMISERTGMELYDTRVLQEAAAKRGLANLKTTPDALPCRRPSIS